MKLGYRPEEAAHEIGSAFLLRRLREAGWLKPIVQVKGMTLYSGVDLAKAWQRFVNNPNDLPK